MIIFFFSSRRRHTRFDCDWSSDVCSSDLEYRRRHLRARVTDVSSQGLSSKSRIPPRLAIAVRNPHAKGNGALPRHNGRSEEHTSELQSQSNLVCRLLLEKTKHRQTHLLLTC